MQSAKGDCHVEKTTPVNLAIDRRCPLRKNLYGGSSCSFFQRGTPVK
jgi:hypothetical protein